MQPRSGVVAIACLGALTGCSVSVGAPTLGHAELASLVSERLTATVGQRPDKVVCPADLEGSEGSVTRCMLTAGGDTYGVTVTTRSVRKDNIRFHIQVDDEPAD